MRYDFTHQFFYRNTSTPKKLFWAPFGRVVIPPPLDIVEQIKSFMEPRYKRFDNSPLYVCRIVYPLSVNQSSLMVVCEPGTKWDSVPAWAFPELLFTLMGTRKVKHRRKHVGRTASAGIIRESNYALGEVNRPRICIIPGLFLLCSLFLLSITVQIFRRGDGLAGMVWMWLTKYYVSEVENTENPLFL